MDDFYLGVSTGLGFSDQEFPPRDVFGWVRLRNENGGLEMVENAVAYGSQGIIVGTTQLVPEPAFGLLLSIAGISVVCLRSRPQNRTVWEPGLK